jgi:hypothetical protein
MALADSPSLQELLIFSSRFPPTVHAVARLLLTTRTLQSLATDLTFMQQVENHADQVLLAQAFENNRSLETLTLYCIFSDASADLILAHLGAHSTLRCLKLKLGLLSHWINSLGQLIVTTCTLQELHLHAHHFAEDEMLVFVNALRSSVSVASLHLSRCRLDVSASQLFVEFVQSLRNPKEPIGSRVRELLLEQCSVGDLDNEEDVRERDIGEMAATMLVDSSLQALHLVGRRVDYVTFFALLTAHSARINIPYLKFGCLLDVEMNVLLHYLATCLHLRELVVRMEPTSSHSRSLCRTLCQSGSLYRVDVCYGMYDSLGGPVLTARESRMVESACDRNRLVPQMLAFATDQAGLGLFPSLFRVARQAPRTALNNMLIGLLVHDEHQFATLRANEGF